MNIRRHESPLAVSIYIAVSIDGYIARRDGGLDWLDRVGGFDEDYGFQKLMESIDAVVLGRKTYEIASTVPDPYPGKKVIVLSKTLDSVKTGMELYKGDLNELSIKLQKEGVKHIWVDGGSTISQFLSLQLVDEMTLSVIPVILGSGIPLFHVLSKEIPCRLISSQSYRSGLVQLHYEIVKQFSESQDKIHFKLVDYGSEDYKKAVTLREEILRKPLGLFFTKEELALEKDHVHILGFLGQEMCVTAVLVPSGDEMKMQRVASKASFQGKGIGSALMRFCEEYAKTHGFKSIYCHARDTAVQFYLKNQYVLEGDPFDEDGIPHHKMRKLM
jgi:dihydrofolate reductase/ribosomal protein S18 acetylase RimI-like enzyme